MDDFDILYISQFDKQLNHLSLTSYSTPPLRLQSSWETARPAQNPNDFVLPNLQQFHQWQARRNHSKFPLHCLIYPIWVFESPLTWSDMSQPEVSEGFQLFSQHLSTPETRESLHQADKFPNCAWEKSRRKLWLMAPFERGVGHQGSSFEKRSTESGNPCPKRNATSPALQAAKHPRTRNAGCNSSKRVLPSHEDKIQIGSWIIVLFLKKRIPKCPSASLDSSLSHLSSHSWLMAGWQVKSVKSVISRTCNWTLTFGKNF